MSVIPHEPSVDSRFAWLRITEMWASLAISVMWLAVLFDAMFGPNITSTTPGGTSSSVPSAVAVSLFATIGTWAPNAYPQTRLACHRDRVLRVLS